MKITPKTYAESFLSLASGKSEKEIDTLAREFSVYFTKRGRAKLLRSIIGELKKIIASQEGERSVTVTIAKEQEDLSSLLKKNLSSLKGKYALSIKVDPALIGGMIMEIGDIRVDASVAHQLRSLRAHIKS